MSSKIFVILIALFANVAKSSLFIKEHPERGTFFIAGREDAEDAAKDPEADIRDRIRTWVRKVEAEGLDPECHDYGEPIRKVERNESAVALRPVDCAEAGTTNRWRFSGSVAKGYPEGRGTLTFADEVTDEPDLGQRCYFVGSLFGAKLVEIEGLFGKGGIPESLMTATWNGELTVRLKVVFSSFAKMTFVPCK